MAVLMVFPEQQFFQMGRQSFYNISNAKHNFIVQHTLALLPVWHIDCNEIVKITVMMGVKKMS